MKKFVLPGLTVLVFLFAGMQLSAQDKEPRSREDRFEKDQSLKIGATLYMEWANLYGWQSDNFSRISRWGRTSSVQSKNHNNTFRVQRVYLTFKKNLGDIFSVHVITDIDTHGSSEGPNNLYLKFVYIQAEHVFGTDKYPVALRAQFGKVQTPNSGFILKRSDLRWIDKEFSFDEGKRVLDGFSTDYSADFGAKAEIDIFKILSYTFAITNGEGYKNQNREILNETYFDAKSYYHMVTLSPIKRWLYLSFHYRDEIAEKHNPSDDDLLAAYIAGEPFEIGTIREGYWGFSLAWDMDLIKTGGGITFPEKKTGRKFNASGMVTNPVYRQDCLVGYAWLHFNLAPIVKPAPLIVIGQFAYGRKYGRLAAYTGTGGFADKTSRIVGAGIGWQFNKNFRIAAYWENQSYIVKTPGAVRAMDGINLASNPTGVLFSGYLTNHFLTRNPVDRNNIFVKIAVEF